MTWTLFDADGTRYIYAAYSRDYGEHFASPKLVSRDSALCPQHLGVPTPQGALQLEPVLAAVHRPRRRALRRLGQLQPHRRAARARARARAAATTSARRRAAASTTARRCCSPSRPTAATRSRRRSRSPTTTTCPTARPTRGRGPGRACVPEKGETPQLGLPGRELPVGRGQPARPDARSSSRSAPTSTATPTSTTAACRRASTRTRSSRSTTASRRRAPATTTSSISRSTNGGADVHRRRRPTCASCPSTRAGDPRADQFWQWAAFDPRGRLAVSYYDRALRRRRDDRVLGHQPVGQPQRPRLRDDARDHGVDAAADAVRGRVLRRLQRAERRRRRASVLDGHAGPGPVRLPRLGGQRDAAAERLHGGLRPRRGGQRSEHLHARRSGIPLP